MAAKSKSKKRKMKPRRRAHSESLTVTPERVDALADKLTEIARAHGGAEAVLQVDFIGGPTGCVIRAAVCERVWQKQTQGAWHVRHLEALAERGLVSIHFRGRMGHQLNVCAALLTKEARLLNDLDALSA